MAVKNITDAAICKLIESAVPQGVSKNGITPEMDLRLNLDMDSLGILTMIFAIEQGLGIELSAVTGQLAEATYVSDIISIVKSAAE